MGRFFDRHSLGRRVVAIAAAYLVALSAVIANFAAARMAAEAIADPLGVICHTGNIGAPSPSGDQNDAGHCIDNCSACCFAFAALPPAPAPLHGIALPIPAAMPLAAPVIIGRLASKSHRSRAPPRGA